MRRRQFSALLGATALAPLAAVPGRAAPAEICGVPVAPDEGWFGVAADEKEPIDRMDLRGTTERIAISSDVNIHAVLIARNGKLVFERYFTGADEVPGRFFVIRAIDAPIFDFFPELSDLRSAEKDRILLTHALTMSMGLKWREAPVLHAMSSPASEPLFAACNTSC
jgi:hypothetical protein